MTFVVIGHWVDYHIGGPSEYLEDAYGSVRERLANTGQPVTIHLMRSGTGYTHALLVYDILESDHTKIMYVYDPNTPDCDVPAITLRIADGVWSMDNYDVYPAFGTLPRLPLAMIAPFSITLTCPVDLELVAPDGSATSKDINEIGDALYFEEDSDGDGEMEKTIVLDYPEEGTYTALLHPYPDAPNDATFSLCVMAGGDTLFSIVEQDVGTISPTGYEIILASDGESAACPRSAGFWQQQCRDLDCSHGEGGPVKFDCTDMDLITASIDARSSYFNWDEDFASFCATTDPARPIDARKQAKRQFAALLANVCVGQLGIVAGNGDIVSLAESTPILSGCEEMGSTVGDVIDHIDSRLTELEPEPIDGVVGEYEDLVSCLDNLNNATNIEFDPYACVAEGNSVEKAFADRRLLEDHQTGDDDGSEAAPLVVHPVRNPFSETTTISYAIGGVSGERVEVAVYDISGRKVRTLQSGLQRPGVYEVTWDGRTESGQKVASGVYFCRLEVDSKATTKKLLLVR